MLAACLLLAVSGVSRAATEDEDPAVSSNKRSSDPKDIKVLIPFFSNDVSHNGCRVRANPQETFSGPDVDLQHLPFKELISETIGRYSVRAILDPPATFMASLAPLDADMRTLVLLDVLRDGLGRDGLHTFFFMSGAQHAPAIRDALAAAGMHREHELFVKAMDLFGPDHPVDNDARAKRFSYSSLDTPLNDFDVKMLEIARSFGGRESIDKAMVAYVENAPALWQKIEAKRAQLGEVARLRYLNQALVLRNKLWNKTDAEVVQALASLPKEHRTLLVMDIFNAEFSNGGVHQFFFNSSGAVAPEVYDAFRELGLERQAAIYKRALDMFPGNYLRDMQKRRDKFFAGDWGPWDERLQKLTDDFYALDGGPTLVRVGDKAAAVEGGPGIWSAMASYAREKKLLPC
jgi:Domain of unknown function (DUF4375)